MKTFVVNLERRPDRRERMERLLPESWAAEYTTYWPGPLDGQRIDPRSLPGYRLFPWQISSENPWWNRPLKQGEIGCAVSHLECWRRAAAANADMVMVLEDDVVLADRCEERLAEDLPALNRLDANWDLVYLGRRALGGDEPVAEAIVRPGFSYCTFGYMLSAAGLAKVLAARLEDALIPVDEFLPALYLDHPRADVRRRYPRRLHAYAFEPPLVADLPYEEAGSDTEASEFAQPGLDGTPFREVLSPLAQPAAWAPVGAHSPQQQHHLGAGAGRALGQGRRGRGDRGTPEVAGRATIDRHPEDRRRCVDAALRARAEGRLRGGRGEE